MGHELMIEKFKLIAILISVIPSNILSYRARLLTLEAFKMIKMNAQGYKGRGYSPWMKPINLLFSMSKTYWHRYDEYIIYVKREKKNYVRTALYSTILILALIIGFQVVQITKIEEFRIPYLFIIQILLLEFQVEIMLAVKI